VSAVLHAFVSLTPSAQADPSTIVDFEGDLAEPTVPSTSQPNVWKPPRKRKESTMMLSDAKFEKHVYGLEKKQYM